MIQLIYFLVLGVALVFFGKLVLLNRRKAVLVGLTFTTFALPALPWQFVQIPNFGVLLNLTFVGFAFLVVFLGHKVRKSAILSSYNVLVVLLGILLFAFTLSSEAQGYGLSKSSFFVYKVIIPMAAYSMLAPFSDDEKNIVLLTLVVASLLTALSLFSFTSWNASALYSRATVVEELNPITVSRTVGIGTVIGFLHAFNYKSTRLRLIVVILITVITILAVVATGSRGPLLSALLASLVTLGFLNVGAGNKLRTTLKIGVFASALFVVYATTDVGDKLEDIGGYQRITMYLSESGRNTSDIERLKRLNVAWDGFLDSKGVGIGTGGFASIYGYREREYPHNLILEVAVELGVIGLLVLITILGVIVYRVLKVRAESSDLFYVQGLFGLWLYAFFNSMVSTDIHGNQALWMFGCLIFLFTWGTTANANRQSSNAVANRA